MLATRKKAPLSSYLIDENDISAKMMTTVPPLRVFTLEGLGINATEFIQFMQPTFSILGVDPYDAKRNSIAFLKKKLPQYSERLDVFLADYYANKVDLEAILDIIVQLPREDVHEFDRIGLTDRRKRSIARFFLKRTATDWNIKRTDAKEFEQNVGVGDVRALVRKFQEAHQFVAEDYPPLQKLMRKLGDMVIELRPEAQTLEMNFHQMFIFADMMSPGENAPEGIHQDGTDYIVSALVIERAGIIGGESIVYGPDKKTEYLRRTLAVGEGIFQADKGSDLWHYVTPIKEDPNVPPAYGHRSVIGFDIDVVA